MNDIAKEVFLKTWPGGYRENWEVYGKASGQKEEDVVRKCLAPFYNKEHVCLEIGCGLAFWTDQYLAPNFKQVLAIDILPVQDFGKVKLKHTNILYIEVPDRDFSCYGIEDNSVDFVWSFGVFCHLSLEANQQYLHGMYKKCKPGAKVALYYSNNDRRPHYKKGEIPQVDPNQPMWCNNDLEISTQMMINAGFTDIKDLMPELFDTMIYGTKS